MATTAAAFEEREFSIGRVFSRGFGTISTHPFVTIGIALVFGALPALIVEIEQFQLIRVTSGGVSAILGMTFASVILNMAVAAIVQGALTLTVLAHGEGRRGDVVDTLPPALIRLAPLALLGLITGFGFAFGLALLVIPGLMLYMTWWVAAPAMIAERLGPIAALSRSSELTRDARWRIFGIEIILAIGGWIVDAALRVFGFHWAALLVSGSALAWTGVSLGTLAIMVLVRTASYSIYSVMHASCYVELRNWKDGPTETVLVEVFR